MPLTVYVRNLGRHADGHWIAEVSAHNNPQMTWLRVNRKHGSWLTEVGDPPMLKEIHPDAKRELQSQVRKLEKRERQAA